MECHVRHRHAESIGQRLQDAGAQRGAARQQDVAAVVIMGAVANAADVHAGAQADVLQRGEGFDFALVVNVLVVICLVSEFRN